MSFEALSPTAFLRRSAQVFADKTAVIDGDQRWTYAQLYQRCARLAGALRNAGIQSGTRVAEEDTIMILESMKMEIPVLAPVAGTLTQILVKETDDVAEGQAVAIIEY